MQHVVQEPDPRAHGDLLRRCELRRVACIFWRHNAFLCGLGGLGVAWWGEVGGWFVGWEDAAVEGERDLDLGLVCYTGDCCCAGFEGHFDRFGVIGIGIGGESRC